MVNINKELNEYQNEVEYEKNYVIDYNHQDYSDTNFDDVERFYKSEYNFHFRDLTPKKIAMAGLYSLPFVTIFLLLFGLSVSYEDRELTVKYDNGSITEVIILLTAGFGGIYYNQNDRKRKTRENMF